MVLAIKIFCLETLNESDKTKNYVFDVLCEIIIFKMYKNYKAF